MDLIKFEGLQVLLQNGEVGEVDGRVRGVLAATPRWEGRRVHPDVPEVLVVVMEEKLVLHDGHER